MATMDSFLLPVRGLWPSFESSSRRVSLRRFLNALRAFFSWSSVLGIFLFSYECASADSSGEEGDSKNDEGKGGWLGEGGDEDGGAGEEIGGVAELKV